MGDERRVLAERIARYRETVCDALGQAGWEINSEAELDAALNSLLTATREPRDASRSVTSSPDKQQGAEE